MRDLIRIKFADKSVVLLGFGREGQSSYTVLREIFPQKLINIADSNDAVIENPVLKNDPNINFITGPAYLECLNAFDMIFRSPGIPIWPLLSDDCPAGKKISRNKITSQTDLFLQAFANQVTGVTGTKGKSTTSSLIHHIFKTGGMDTLLVGNIGNPAFHFIDLIKPGTRIVYELSSHQLEYIEQAPHIAVLLNLFQEHLDAYPSFEDYQLAKINITKFQKPDDYLIYNADDELLTKRLQPYLKDRICMPFSLQPQAGYGVTRKIHQDRFLLGEHNLKNILAAMKVARILGVSEESVEDGIAGFKGLAHRLEYVGEFHGIHFYDDSIATIPEACMEAVKALPFVDTLVAGGFDRGLDYSVLAAFLSQSDIRNLILTGAAGKRLGEELERTLSGQKKIFYIRQFDDFRDIAFRETKPGFTCLLSPAAASYDEFNNFEERGKRYSHLIRSFLFVLVCLIGFQAQAQKPDYTATVQAYIKQYREMAIQEMLIYRIPASITLAQGIIESRAGLSPMAVEANNHFGIKCHQQWYGKTFYQRDDYDNECFRKYDSPRESYRDHSYFLTQRERYKGLFKLDVSDYKGWAKGLQSAGYATNPVYADLLIKTIEKYGLYQYDKGSFQSPFASATDDLLNSAWLQSLEVFGVGPNNRTVYVNNDLQLTIARQGDDISSLARDFGVGIKKLRKFNDLPEYSSAVPGQIFYLEPKRRKGASAAHVVRAGETLQQISQLYGIKLNVLIHRNKLRSGVEPQPGKVLKLR